MDRRAVAQVHTLVSVSTATALHSNGRRGLSLSIRSLAVF